MLKPTETKCPVCDEVFLQPCRRQGGGVRSIYCSARCRSKDWIRGNGASRKASILKYDNKPESKEKKKDRTRRTTLSKYGWTEAQFQHQLQRQNFSCYGCLERLDTYTARIDHCHETQKVRGLLCNHCNWALGLAKDSPAILRRLMAYLDHQREKTNIYLIGTLKNLRIPDIGNILRAEGYDVMDEWFTPGELADLNWQEYEKKRGRSYAEALKGRAATNIFMFDRSYLDHCDIAVLVMPAGKSGMLELGYAKGRGKYTIIFLDGTEPDRYDIMPKFADQVCVTEEDLLHAIQTTLSSTENI